MLQILHHHHLDTASLPTLLGNADGMTVLALLCNAAAKNEPAFYVYKAGLVATACIMAGRDNSYVDVHEDMLVYFIETNLRLDGERLHIAFHFVPGTELPDLAADWPRAAVLTSSIAPFARRKARGRQGSISFMTTACVQAHHKYGNFGSQKVLLAAQALLNHCHSGAQA